MKNKTKLVEWFFYLRSGAGVVDIFKNIGYISVGAYLAIKISYDWLPLWLLGVWFIVAIPVLIVVGYYYVHRVAKKSEELATKFGTHYGIKSYELQEEQVRLLKLIYENLSKSK